MKTSTASRDGLRTTMAQNVSLLNQERRAREAAREARSASPPARVELGGTGVLRGLDERLLRGCHVLVGREAVHGVDVVHHPALLDREAMHDAGDDRVAPPEAHG